MRRLVCALLIVALLVAILIQGCSMSVKIATLYAELTADPTKLIAGANQAKVSLTGVATAAGTATAATNGMTSAMTSSAQSMLGPIARYLSVGAAIAGVVSVMKKSIDAAAEAQKINAQLEQVLKSTGYAAGMTADQLRDLATSLSRVTAFEDDVIIKAQSVMLTFTKIGSEVFPDAIEAALNLSTVLGQDLQSSVIQIGKALNVSAGDTTAATMAMSAMRRVGVAFTTDQVAMATRLVETGDIMAYQQLILGELSTEFGGQAAAALNTYSGRVQQLNNDWGNLLETMGGASLDEGEGLVAQADKVVIAADQVIQIFLKLREEGGDWRWYDYLLPTAGLIDVGIRNINAYNDILAGLGDTLVDVDNEASRAAAKIGNLNDEVEEASEIHEEFARIAQGASSSLSGMAAQAYITQLSIDGMFTYEDAQAVLDYRMAIGDLTTSEYEAQVMALMLQDTLAQFPGRIPITVDFNYVNSPAELRSVLQHGTGSAYEVGARQQRAGGGAARGYFVAGDPGPHEELIYAPGGAYVYNASQTRAMKSSGRYPHYAIGNLPQVDQTLDQYQQVYSSILRTSGYQAAQRYSSYWTAPTTAMQDVLGISPVPIGLGSSSGITSPTASLPPSVTTAITQAVSAASQAVSAVSASAGAVESVSDAAVQISDSSRQTTSAIHQGTQSAQRSSAELLGEVRALRNDIKRLITGQPRQWAQAAAKVGQL